MILLSAVGTALVVWVLNRQVINILGERAVTTAAFIEELCKTGAAVLLKVPLVALHALFGVVEGIYDLAQGGTPLPAAAAVFSHLLFGAVTLFLLSRMGFWGAWLSVSLLHLAWNMAVVKISKRRTL